MWCVYLKWSRMDGSWPFNVMPVRWFVCDADELCGCKHSLALGMAAALLWQHNAIASDELILRVLMRGGGLVATFGSVSGISDWWQASSLLLCHRFPSSHLQMKETLAVSLESELKWCCGFLWLIMVTLTSFYLRKLVRHTAHVNEFAHQQFYV